MAAIEAFLDEVGPRGLLLEGEPGIGKTSVWAAGVEAARERGVTVLAARPTGTEVRLSFAGLSDLLDPLPPSVRVAAAAATAGARCCVASPGCSSRFDSTRARLARPSSAFSARLRQNRRPSWPSTTCSGSIRLPVERSSSRCDGWSTSSVALLATARMGAQEPPPMDLERCVPDGRSAAHSRVPAERSCTSTSCCRTSSDSTCRGRHSASARAGRRQSLLRTRDRAPARGWADRGEPTSCRCRVPFESSCMSDWRGCR